MFALLADPMKPPTSELPETTPEDQFPFNVALAALPEKPPATALLPRTLPAAQLLSIVLSPV